MIPFLSIITFQLGPFTIYVWGLMVSLGFLLAGFMAARFAKQRGDDPSIIWDLLVWVAMAGMIGGRLGHVLFYEPSYYLLHPIEIIAVWKGGLSLYGGLILASIVGVLYLRHRKVDVFRYADIVAFGLPFGKWIGRIGCFLIHDHPGTATDFILGVKYPDEIIRHDLGLYLSINAFFMAMFMLWLSRKPRPVGTYLCVFAIWYGISRFFLDFLRTIDVRYFGLTPGQYFSIILFGFGVWLLLWIKRMSKRALAVKITSER